jgi:hypothetical protein
MVCANCGASLVGEYCASCGQRHEPHIHTVAHFAGEAFESISHADSRLWRTLWYLLSRPGYLTREFFTGHRVSYLPPFRLYLVISVLFFVAVGTPTGGAIQVDVGDAATPAERIEKMRATADELEKDTGPASEALKVAATALRRKAQEESAAVGVAEPGIAGGAEEDATAPTMKSTFCEKLRTGGSGGANYPRLYRACNRVAEDSGAALYKSVVHNIPRAMFVFLPLLALMMRLLYWRPQRYYVEHLLFLVHNHAFVFLVLTALALLTMIPVVGEHLGLLKFAAWLYMFWYMFRAMRNVYGQRRFITLMKYFTIGFGYVIAGATVLLLTTLYSAMTIA